MNTRKEIYDKVIEIVHDHLGHHYDAHLAGDSTLMGDLCAGDSDIVEITMTLEETFGLAFADGVWFLDGRLQDIDHLKLTVDMMVDTVCCKLGVLQDTNRNYLDMNTQKNDTKPPVTVTQNSSDDYKQSLLKFDLETFAPIVDEFYNLFSELFRVVEAGKIATFTRGLIPVPRLNIFNSEDVARLLDKIQFYCDRGSLANKRVFCFVKSKTVVSTIEVIDRKECEYMITLTISTGETYDSVHIMTSTLRASPIIVKYVNDFLGMK